MGRGGSGANVRQGLVPKATERRFSRGTSEKANTDERLHRVGQDANGQGRAGGARPNPRAGRAVRLPGGAVERPGPVHALAMVSPADGGSGTTLSLGFAQTQKLRAGGQRYAAWVLHLTARHRLLLKRGLAALAITALILVVSTPVLLFGALFGPCLLPRSRDIQRNPVGSSRASSSEGSWAA